ncbi:hypothetical protein [Agromyces sp. GXQ0307]|uniref:hypothetical protein n=1 Tax=Agromyces sp. GXQ0307 TaxID=3377835 RepID=UPI00383A39D9
MSERRGRTVVARVALAAAVMFPAAGLAGCNVLAGDEPLPPEELEGIAIGANAELSGIDVRSIVLISRDAGEPGRMLGTLFNRTDSPVEVTFSDEDDSVTVVAPVGELVKFEEQETVIGSVEQRPGSYVTIRVSAEGEDVSMDVPVFDGDLEFYAPFVPST